jgi:hypothetical protein
MRFRRIFRINAVIARVRDDGERVCITVNDRQIPRRVYQFKTTAWIVWIAVTNR